MKSEVIRPLDIKYGKAVLMDAKRHESSTWI